MDEILGSVCTLYGHRNSARFCHILVGVLVLGTAMTLIVWSDHSLFSMIVSLFPYPNTGFRSTMRLKYCFSYSCCTGTPRYGIPGERPGAIVYGTTQQCLIQEWFQGQSISPGSSMSVLGGCHCVHKFSSPSAGET